MRNICPAGNKADGLPRLETLLLELVRACGSRLPIVDAHAYEGITTPQLNALLWLGVDGPLTMGELARRGGITEKTITGIVDRLERATLVRRERDERDRRIVRARLTRKGSASFRRLRSDIEERLGILLGLLEPGDQQALFRILETICQRLGSLELTHDRHREHA